MTPQKDSYMTLHKMNSLQNITKSLLIYDVPKNRTYDVIKSR